MAWFYDVSDFNLGKSSQSGHEVYLDATYYSPNKPGTKTKVILKKNKFNNPLLSRWEVAFSQLARVFLNKNATSSQKLVVDGSNQVWGIAVEHLCYVIEGKEGLNKSFYQLKTHPNGCTYKAAQVSCAEKIPYYFFDKLPQGFFARLLEAEKKRSLTIDYDSLVSVLGTSYTLEEDDLHKGNFGFYMIEKDKKPQVVFFKIDHDLMFTDSIMSFCTRRVFHWFSGEHAFDVSANDLLNFPKLSVSKNYYWPTKISAFSNPWDNKNYLNTAELNAFAHLGEISEFKKAKWKVWYKHILIPEQLIELSLKSSLDEMSAQDRAQVALITAATVARQAKLKAVLFSIKEFRDFVSELTPQDHEYFIQDIVDSSPVPQEGLSSRIERSLLSDYEDINRIEEGDTPLHTAIKLGDYRYEETLQMLGQFINDKNKSGKTPLDCALELAQKSENTSNDIRKDHRFIMKHLLEHGAKPTPEFKTFNLNERLQSYTFKTGYIDLTLEAQTYSEFKTILKTIGEENSFCLKFKKNLAIECIKLFIETNQNHSQLQSYLIQLKRDINAHSTDSEFAPVQYIRQLRSKLLIVRQFRGLFGWTSTQAEVNSIINEKLDKNHFKALNQRSFFNNKTSDSDGYVPAFTA